MKISYIIAVVFIGFISAASAQDKKVDPALSTPPSMTVAPATPVTAPAAIQNPNAPDFKFNEEEFNFGTIKQGESVTHEFSFVNTGKEPLIIASAAGSCGCTVPEYPKQAIMKGDKATIKVTFNSAGKMGMQDKTVTIQSNAKTNPKVIHIKGNVEAPPKAPDAAPAVPVTPAGGGK
ncbi:MAG TPA: DUF1573 domain-containing protein [Bacteroidia bacterium]|nr:DUF1573 domain-containing protein [Bacteroidia bacterium]